MRKIPEPALKSDGEESSSQGWLMAPEAEAESLQTSDRSSIKTLTLLPTKMREVGESLLSLEGTLRCSKEAAQQLQGQRNHT